jgi:hypothetical protein
LHILGVVNVILVAWSYFVSQFGELTCFAARTRCRRGRWHVFLDGDDGEERLMGKN